MSSFFDQAVQEYHDEFNTLPYEYYDSGARDWREDFTHQPEIPPTRYVPTDKDYAAVKQRFQSIVEGFASVWRKDTTPAKERDRLFYARRYCNYFRTLSRWAENPCVSQEVYDKFSELSLRYEELVAKLEGQTPLEFYRYKLAWQSAETIKWQYWPD